MYGHTAIAGSPVTVTIGGNNFSGLNEAKIWGADKSLARPGRKQANVSVRMA